MEPATPILALRGIRKRFGRLEVLHGVDLEQAPAGCNR
jgi:ABC-type sugar transport system ATPase subunit